MDYTRSGVVKINHSNSRKKGVKRLAAIKLDMSKAYDRVEWTFLENMMRRMGFHHRWVQLIMKCVSSVSYKIKVNDFYTHRIIPQRGLRQGDPLSPYCLFYVQKGFQHCYRKLNRRASLRALKSAKEHQE